MKDTKAFVDIFLRGSSVSGWALTAFALGLIAIGILSNAAYDILVDPPVIFVHGWLIIATIAILIVIAYLLFLWDMRHNRHIEIAIDENRLAPPTAGIIWLLSPNIEPLLSTLHYHQKNDAGTHCWIIMQKDEAILGSAYSRLIEEKQKHNWNNLALHPYYIGEPTAKSAYEAVTIIITREAREEELTISQLICDITGGLKPLTAGMMLASIALNCKVEYVESNRDDKGRPIPGTQQVVLVDTKFYLTRDNDG